MDGLSTGGSGCLWGYGNLGNLLVIWYTVDVQTASELMTKVTSCEF